MLRFNDAISSARMLRRVAGGVVAALTIGACASSGANSTAAGTAPAPHTSRDVLTAAELSTVQADNLYDAIQKLRPEFLRSDQAGEYGPAPTGTAGSGGSTTFVRDAVVDITLYRDNVRLSGLDDLRHILISEVKEVRHLKGPQAAVRFGTNNSAGAIVITSK